MNNIALIILLLTLFAIMFSSVYQIMKLFDLKKQLKEYKDIVFVYGSESHRAILKREINNSEKFKILADKVDAEYRASKKLEEFGQ